MRYWITTRWPHRRVERNPVHRNVYVPEGREEDGAELRPGDLVFVLEAKGGRTEIRQDVNQGEVRYPCVEGRGGIVALLKAASRLEADPRTTVTQYTDGTEIWWRWKADAEPLLCSSFVSREEVCRVLGHSPDYSFRGIGKRRSGLKELTASQFAALHELYLRKRPGVSAAAAEESPPIGRAFEGSGESEAHRTLKEYVAAHPERALGEKGVVWEATEFSFITGDRADVVLRDSFSRLIGVEIELSQLEGQREGVLQAIKYRHMLAVVFGVPFLESRSLLVAYQLAPAVKQLCERYAVEWREVDRAAVARWAQSRV